MNVQDIIAQARSRLGDEDKHRWTDNRLTFIVSQGQRAICKLAGILRKNIYIPMGKDITLYTLPPDCQSIHRLEYDNLAMPILTRSELDVLVSMPTTIVGVKTNLDMGLLEIYPKAVTCDNIVVLRGIEASLDFVVLPTYGVITSGDSPIVVDPLYGEVTSISREININLETAISNGYGSIADSNLVTALTVGTTTGNYGVVVDIGVNEIEANYGFITSANLGIEVSGVYGLATNVATTSCAIKVYYEATPLGVLTPTSELVIPDLWLDAMVKFTVGTALQDDNDANNMARGASELATFTQEVLKARELSSKQFSSGVLSQLTTNYRRI